MPLRVTAIIPTCERPVFLLRSLQSIAEQDLAPNQIIVVDDAGQQDAVRAGLNEAGFGSVEVVTNSHLKGPSGTRNTGADLATGDLLAFLDDDDEWLPSYLSEAQRRFESNNLDVMCTDMLCRFDDGVDHAAKTAPDRLVPALFLTRNPGLVGSNLIIRRSTYFAVGGFDESIPAAEDMDFGVRLSLMENLKYERLQRRLVRIHQHSGPRSSRPGEAIRHGIRRFYELYESRMNERQREEFRNNAGRFWGIDEHGRTLNLTPKAHADFLLPTLKAWLDQRRSGFRS